MKSFNSLFYNRLLVFVALLAAVLYAACSDEESVAPDENHAPEVEFTITAVAVPMSSDKVLTVSVSDPDDDQVSVSWEATRGEFRSAQGNPSITWRAPSTTGRDTITVTASDGNGGTTKKTETILVGTVKQSGVSTAVWSLAGAPYIIRPGLDKKFAITPGGVLTVEAGCELLVEGEELQIWTEGTLRTNGTASQPVVIRPNLRQPEAGYWGGIIANPNSPVAPRILLTNTTVLYAKEAVKAVSPGEITLDGCTIMFASNAAVLHESTGNLTVANCAITNNAQSGIRVIRPPATDVPALVAITYDSIAANGDLTGSTPYVNQAAIYVDIPDTLGECDFKIAHNEISRNGVPGIQLVSACYPAIDSNSVFANELGKTSQRYNIRLDDGFGAGVAGMIDARWNYWGSAYPNLADSVAIRRMIRDSEDVGNITVRVAIDPWLHAKP